MCHGLCAPSAHFQGNAEAQFELGCCYFNGDGVPQSFKKAFDLWSKSFVQGECYSVCQRIARILRSHARCTSFVLALLLAAEVAGYAASALVPLSWPMPPI